MYVQVSTTKYVEVSTTKYVQVSTKDIIYPLQCRVLADR